MADDTMPPWVDAMIVVRYDGDLGRPVYDLDGIDPWSAVTMLRQAADAIYNNELPEPLSSAEAILAHGSGDEPDEDE